MLDYFPGMKTIIAIVDLQKHKHIVPYPSSDVTMAIIPAALAVGIYPQNTTVNGDQVVSVSLTLNV